MIQGGMPANRVLEKRETIKLSNFTPKGVLEKSETIKLSGFRAKEVLELR